MSWLSNLFGLIGNIGKVAKGAGDTALGYANLAYQKSKDNHLTGAQREANQFSAQQAEIARDWQEKMYNQYESPQARIRQYEEAGLNPALMYGDATGGNMPNASSPSSVSPPGGDINGAIGQLIGLKKSIAEIANINADTEYKKEQSESEKFKRDKITAEIGVLASEQSLNEKERKELLAIQAIVEGKHGDLFDLQKDLASVQVTKETEEGKIIKANADFLLEHGFTREQAAMVLSAIIVGGSNILSTIGNLIPKLKGKVPKTTTTRTRTDNGKEVKYEEVIKEIIEE